MSLPCKLLYPKNYFLVVLINTVFPTEVVETIKTIGKKICRTLTANKPKLRVLLSIVTTNCMRICSELEQTWSNLFIYTIRSQWAQVTLCSVL